MRSRAVAVLAVLLLATVAAAAGKGRRGALTLKVAGGPPPAKTLRQLALLGADTGEVVAVDGIGKRAKTVLRPAPGVLFAAVADVGARGARSGVSRVFRVDPALAAVATVKPLRGPGAVAATAAVAGVTSATGSPGGGLVVTMGSIPVEGGSGRTGSIAAGLLTGVFDATHDAGTRWVNTDQRFLDAHARELQLQADGKLDPSTPVRDELLTPNARVEGDLAIDGGHMTGEIRIVDPATGDVIHRIPVDRDFDKDSIDDLRKLLGDLSDELIKKILDLLPTTTTTSTSTMTTSTTTTTTIATTTTTVTMTTVVTTTVPTTTTTSSSTTSTTVLCGGGLVASVEVFYDILGSSQAQSGGNLDPKTFDTGPVTLPLGSAGGSDTQEYTLHSMRGTAEAFANGAVTWDLGRCQLHASGTFGEKSQGGSETTVATTGLDARFQIKLKVKQQTPFTLTGHVKASGTPNTGPPLQRYLKCTGHFGEADGNIQSPSGIAIPFGETSSLHPDDEYVLLCAVVRGGSSTVLGDDDADLEWSWTITLGS
ncbi:MAG: hypothetical protein KIT14_10030 [bacterium]|nr:hypothetical protein [bacterium]